VSVPKARRDRAERPRPEEARRGRLRPAKPHAVAPRPDEPRGEGSPAPGGAAGIVSKARKPLARVIDRGWYPADLLLFAYLVGTSLLMIFSPLGKDAGLKNFVFHFLLLGTVLLLHYARRNSPWPFHFFRHAYALMSLPFLYNTVQYLSRLTTERYFDDWIVGKEFVLFGCQPSQILYSAIPSIALSEFLHLAYLAYVLLTPLVALTLYFTKRYEPLKEFTTTVMATFLFCYAVFTVFPVRGPFYYFGPIDPQAKGVLFPRLVHGMLTRAASVGTAFPSSHVAGSVAIWIVARRYLPRLSHGLLVIAAGIFFGTVYGGFHYALDALSGVAVGVFFGLLGPKLHAWIRRIPGLAQSAAESVVLAPAPRLSYERAAGSISRARVARRKLRDDAD